MSDEQKAVNHYTVGLVMARNRERGEYISSKDPVFGYPHSFGATRVLLILKDHPDWQMGRYNGIGGLVKPGETPADAMYREFEEETGLALEGWRRFCIYHAADVPELGRFASVVHFYLNWADHDELAKAIERKRESVEPLAFMTVRDILADDVPIIHGLRWLIQIARNVMVGAEYCSEFEVWEKEKGQNVKSE